MGGKEKIRICKQYSTKKDRRLGELNEKIKRKALLYVSFSLDFLERGTFTEYPFLLVLLLNTVLFFSPIFFF